MLKGTIIEPFHHKGKWYFAGDPVEGSVAQAAEKEGSLRQKAINGAPSNKAMKKEPADASKD